MSSISSMSNDLQMDFMTLLVAQLQYQDPLDPVTNTDMTAQLAQISQLEQMEQMNSFSEQLLAATQRAEAADLIGKQIAYLPENSEELVLDTVEGIDLSSGSVMVVLSSGKSVSMDDVQGIVNN